MSDLVYTKAQVDTLLSTASSASGGVPGTAVLDSFAGSADDDKLTAAMSYAAAQTVPPAILLDARSHTFNTARTMYDGFALIGAPGHGGDPELSSVGATRTKVVNNGGNTWLNASGGVRSASQVWDCVIRNIAFTGNSTTQWIGGSAVIWSMNIRDCGWSSYKSILGSQATKLLINLCLFDGWLMFENAYTGMIHLGGSDNNLFMGVTNIDSGTAFNSAGNSAGQYHLWLDSLEKTVIGGIYITCEGNWGGIKVSGPAYNVGGGNLGGPLWISGAKVEGRNAGAPCNGANVRIEGGIVSFDQSWISYGMANPTSMGHSPTDAGLIHQTAGYVILDKCTYDTATGVTESQPWLYQAGGEARVINTSRGSKGGVWSGLPQVHSAGGTLTSDSTVTVV